MEKTRRSTSPPRRSTPFGGQAPQPHAVQTLSPMGGVAPSDATGLAPAPLLRGALNEHTWRDLCDRVRAFPCKGDVRVLNDRLELPCPLEPDDDGVRRLSGLINELTAGGHCAQACDLLWMCAPSARARVLLGIDAPHLHTLKDHGDAQLRKRFQGALVGAAEYANAQVRLGVKREFHEFVLEHLGYFCSDDSRARLALMQGDVAGFWQACAHGTDEEWAALAPWVPDGFAGAGDASDRVSNPRLFCWVCENIQAGFKAGLTQGLTACVKWLDRAEGWVDADLRRALVRSAVAHALSVNAPLQDEPLAQLNGLAGLLDRAWAVEPTPRWLREVPVPYRERLLSAAVQRAANASSTQALEGMVDFYLALCGEPDQPADDRHWLNECLRSAVDGLLASDSGRSDAERAAIRALQARVDRGLPDQLADHIQNTRWAAAADCLGEMCWWGGPGFALQHFQALADGFQERLKSVGLSYGLAGGGLQIGVLSESADAGLQATVEQVIELEYLLSLLVRCGLGDHHPLEAVVRRYLESDAVRQSRSDVKVARLTRQHRLRAHLMQRACKGWRFSIGSLWETRAWLDQLCDVGAHGLTVLRKDMPLRTPEFGDWLEAMCRDGKASQALLASAVAMAMDGEACDAVSMAWLFERFADGLDLPSVLMVMLPPVPAGEVPLTGFDRLVRIAHRLVSHTHWLARMEGEVGWRPGWAMALDFCRYVAAQTEPASASMKLWLRRFVLDHKHADHDRRMKLARTLWVRALVNGLACDGAIHAALMGDYQHHDAMKIHLWEHENLELFLSLMEPQPQPLTREADPSQRQALLRHNLAKGLVRSSQALGASRKDACAPTEGYGSPFAWRAHWASALVSASRELLSQPEGEGLLANVAGDATALWAGAAKVYPQWLDTDIDPDDAVWVSGLIEIFRSKDIPGAEKPQHLQARVVAWRESLLAPKAL